MIFVKKYHLKIIIISDIIITERVAIHCVNPVDCFTFYFFISGGKYGKPKQTGYYKCE